VTGPSEIQMERDNNGADAGGSEITCLRPAARKKKLVKRNQGAKAKSRGKNTTVAESVIDHGGPG